MFDLLVGKVMSVVDDSSKEDETIKLNYISNREGELDLSVDYALDPVSDPKYSIRIFRYDEYTSCISFIKAQPIIYAETSGSALYSEEESEWKGDYDKVTTITFIAGRAVIKRETEAFFRNLLKKGEVTLV